MSFPDLRRWPGGHKATEDRAGLSSVSECGGWGHASQGSTGTSWNEPERGGTGRVRETVG